MNADRGNALFRDLNALGALAISAVLLMAFWDQFTGGGLPCPLCLLQRVGCVAVLFGLLLNVIYGPKAGHYSVMLLGACFGAAVALRQVSLHVVPPNPGYGGTFFGFHYYTWAFMVFAAVILGTAIVSAFAAQYREQRYLGFREQPALGRLAIAVALLVIAANVLSAFAECGFGACPDDPVSYWLFD